VQGSGCRFQGSGFRVQGSGGRGQSSRGWIRGVCCGAQGSGHRGPVSLRAGLSFLAADIRSERKALATQASHPGDDPGAKRWFL